LQTAFQLGNASTLLVGYLRSRHSHLVYICTVQLDRKSAHAVPLFSGWLSCAPPSSLLITASPLLLHVAKPLLDVVDCRLVTGVLADIVADFNSVATRSRCDLDDYVERYRFLPSRLLYEIICCCQLRSRLISSRMVHVLVKNVPTPNVGWKPCSSAAALYLKHRSMFSESENTMVFLSLIPSWS
jgi:hypothetical protein